ncbi:MAG TPA: ribosome maturation factor RimM [Longimicrobiales bacterium]|nr:ribosome maturation factor RimM [Longimicrobiales bacterium]
MGHTDPGFLVVGHLTKPHGIYGEIMVKPLTDHPEGTFAPGVVLFLADRGGQHPDLALPPLTIVGARHVRTGVIVGFRGIESRNEAEILRGRYLLREFAEVAPLQEGEVFHHQLLGMEVVTVDGVSLGTVREVYDLAPVELLEVRGAERETMIPFRKEIVREVDPKARRIVVDPPEGLLDL